MILRKSISEDAAKFIELKQKLQMPKGEATSTGGFLLGTSLEQYHYFIKNDLVFVMEDEGMIAGFSIVLNYETLVGSELWVKKDAIDFPFLPDGFFDDNRIAYYEQLAVLPGAKYRTYGKQLALKNLLEGFKDHDYFFTTVVKEPILNTAPLPFMRAVGFVEVGELDETYPVVGDIKSRIFFLQKEAFQNIYLTRWKQKMDPVICIDLAS